MLGAWIEVTTHKPFYNNHGVAPYAGSEGYSNFFGDFIFLISLPIIGICLEHLYLII
jgi:hypothetical protein